MSKNESKIPLVLAVIFLGYVVFWGIRYANSHKPTQIAPVTQVVTRPVQQAPVQPALVATEAAPGQAPAQTMQKHAPVNPPEDPYESSDDGTPANRPPADYMQNRKLAGITDAAGKKH